MRIEKFYLTSNDIYEKFYLAVKGLIELGDQERLLSDSLVLMDTVKTIVNFNNFNMSATYTYMD